MDIIALKEENRNLKKAILHRSNERDLYKKANEQLRFRLKENSPDYERMKKKLVDLEEDIIYHKEREEKLEKMIMNLKIRNKSLKQKVAWKRKVLKEMEFELIKVPSKKKGILNKSVIDF